MTSPRSVRLDSHVRRRLDRYVQEHPGESASSVISGFVDEALRAEDHPGVTFRSGPTGRRAGLVGGPDIWEVIGTLMSVRDADPDLEDDALVTATAAAIGQPERRIRMAVRYYAAYRAEIDERIATNQAAADAAEALWQAEQDVLRTGRRAS